MAGRSHPALVTARRLSSGLRKWGGRLSDSERAAFLAVHQALHRIAGEDDGRRADAAKTDSVAAPAAGEGKSNGTVN